MVYGTKLAARHERIKEHNSEAGEEKREESWSRAARGEEQKARYRKRSTNQRRVIVEAFSPVFWEYTACVVQSSHRH